MLQAYKYSDLTGKIIGCAIKIHNVIGCGFQEVIYQRCMAIEFKRCKLDFEREKEIHIFYQGIQVGTRRMDFLVENKIMVELKAVKELEDNHLVQGLNYIEAFNLDIGLLINFGSKRLEFKRLINDRNHDGPRLP